MRPFNPRSGTSGRSTLIRMKRKLVSAILVAVTFSASATIHAAIAPWCHAALDACGPLAPAVVVVALAIWLELKRFE